MGFIKHWRLMECVGYFAHRGQLPFSRKKTEAISLNNIVNQKYIIKSEWKHNYDVFSWSPLVLLCFNHVNAMFQSFFMSFSIGLFVYVQKYVI